jgi:tellurite resistance protein
MTRARPAGWTEVAPNHFAIPFGVIGLSGAWKAAQAILGTPGGIAPALAVTAAAIWIGLCGGYMVQLVRSAALVRRQLTDPIVSPFAAFAPISAMLLGEALLPYAHRAGQVIIAVSLVATVAYGAWWIAQLILRDDLRLDQIHSAYLIPVAVGGIEATSAVGAAGWTALARLCFGAGLIGWAVFGGLTLARQLLRPMPPTWLRPTLVIDAAVAAAVGTAYFSLYGITAPSGLAYAVAGYGLVMASAQIRLLPRYAALPFSPAAWVFVFATAVAAADVLRWTAAASDGWRWPAWTVLTAASAVAAWVATRTAIAVVAELTRGDGTGQDPGCGTG